MRGGNELSLYTLVYETCNRSNKETPIIEKPVRFGFEKPHDLPQYNFVGRKQDNICIDCLNEEIETFLRKK